VSTIKRNEAQIIAWGGEVEGPVQERNAMGAPIESFSFKAKLGVGDAELHDMIIRVPASVLRELGLESSPERDELARRCVARYVEQHCKDKWVPGREEHFTLNSEEMGGLRQTVLQQPQTKPLLCTVKLPRADKTEPECKVVEVNSRDNAAIKLKTRMNADTKYNWDLAEVVESHEKP
jgi:hypothetical protein